MQFERGSGPWRALRQFGDMEGGQQLHAAWNFPGGFRHAGMRRRQHTGGRMMAAGVTGGTACGFAVVLLMSGGAVAVVVMSGVCGCVPAVILMCLLYRRTLQAVTGHDQRMGGHALHRQCHHQQPRGDKAHPFHVRKFRGL